MFDERDFFAANQQNENQENLQPAAEPMMTSEEKNVSADASVVNASAETPAADMPAPAAPVVDNAAPAADTAAPAEPTETPVSAYTAAHANAENEQAARNFGTAFGGQSESYGSAPQDNYRSSYNSAYSQNGYQSSTGYQGNYNTQSTYGQNTYQQGSYNQSSYNQGSYNQGSYSQNAYSQNAYGQPSNAGFRSAYQNQTSDPAGSGKPKGGKIWKRVAAFVLAGVLLGSSAAGAFLGITAISKKTASVITEDGTAKAQENEPKKIVRKAETEEKTEEMAEEKAEEKKVEEAKETAKAEKEDDQKADVKTVSTTKGTTNVVVTDVTGIVEQCMPTIVAITNKAIITSSFWGQNYQQEATSAGSGIIIGQNDDELLIVTNNHVVDGANELVITFINDDNIEAKIKGTDPSMDLAVVAVNLDDISDETLDAIAIASIGDSDALKVGQPVVAIGNAMGIGQSVTTGVVSSLKSEFSMDKTEKINHWIQTDAAINPGNSGGALLDYNGNVIGINSAKIGGDKVEGMGYAIPISDAQEIIENLMNKVTRDKVEAEKKGYLGISCVTVDAAAAQSYKMPYGIYVAQVYAGTGAEAAGLKKGDIIVGIDGVSVSTQEEFTKQLQYFAVDETVNISIIRPDEETGEYNQEMDLDVRLVSREVLEAADQNK